MYVCHTNQIGFTRNSLSIVFVARKCNKIFSFVSFKWKLDTFVSHVRVVAIKTDESVTLVHMVRLNNQEVNLAAHKQVTGPSIIPKCTRYEFKVSSSKNIPTFINFVHSRASCWQNLHTLQTFSETEASCCKNISIMPA